MRSSTVSMPTDSRMSPSVMPRRSRSAAENETWVVVAGCRAIERTSPMFVMRLISCNASKKRSAPARPPRTVNAKTDPACPPKRSCAMRW